MDNERFTLWGAFDVVEKSDEDGTPLRGQIKGIATSQAIDADGETIVQDGIKWDYFLDKGFVSLEHPLGVTNIVGEPVSIERIRMDGIDATALTADLFLNDATARDIWEKSNTLKKANSKRRLGFSIEGRCLERDGTIINKSEVMSVAISPVPKNPYTWFEPIMQSLLYRAIVGNPGMVTGFGGAGNFAPMIPQSLQGIPLSSETYEFNSDMETELITALLRKLPQLTWDQGSKAIKAFMQSRGYSGLNGPQSSKTEKV